MSLDDPSPVRAPTTSAREARSDGSIHVLHVDDEADLTEVVAATLERESDRIDVSTATSASDGLDLLDEAAVDCVVSDYQMPGMDGLAFLDRVRERDADLPFILYTGKGSEEIASEAISSGVTDYLQKETGTDQYTVLANRVENAVDRYRAKLQVERAFQVMETAREGISVLDEDGYFLYVNDTYVDIVGYDREELLGSHWELLYPEAEVDTVREEILPAIPSEGRWTGETVYERADGEHVLVDHAIAYADDGTMICLIQDLTDGTDDGPLVKEQAFIDCVLDALDDVFYVLDQGGNIVRVNDRAVRASGFSREELTSMAAHEAIVDEDRDAIADAIAETLNTGSSSVEASLRTKDGDPVPHEFRTRRLTDGEGRVIGLVGIGRDVTERRRREQRLRRQARQFEAFGSVLSHDMRNPLNVVQARVEWLADELDAADDVGDLDREQTTEHLAAVERSTDRLDTLVTDLASVMQEGEFAGDVTDVDLESAVRAAWGALESAEATLDVAATATIRADEAALERLFDNLLGNAVEHGGPDVTVRVGTTDRGFYVADDGPGIPAEERDEVFEPGVTSKEEGSGFGLASAHQIVFAHGWDVEVSESADGGARFDVREVEFVD